MSRWIYLHRDTDNNVLYVGCTDDLRRRNREHLKGSRWRARIARIEVDSYREDWEALRRENELIRLYEPPFNIRGNPAREREQVAWNRLACSIGVYEAAQLVSSGTAIAAFETWCAANSRALLDQVAS